MATRRQPPISQSPIEPKEWGNPAEIDRAIAKLQRRISELKTVDVRSAVLGNTGQDHVAISNTREAIREIFGPHSPEFQEHQHIQMWAGGMYVGMDDHELVEGTERGRQLVIGILNGLIARLQEKKEDLIDLGAPALKLSLRHLNLHPRVAEVAGDLFEDGYHWEAVFAAAKALVNYVKERSGQHQLDGTGLVRTVFSRNAPILAFNDLANQTELDEQEGMMHLFEGVVLGIRNPGGHAFPEGSEQRAMEYLSLISLLAYRTQEAKRKRGP